MRWTIQLRHRLRTLFRRHEVDRELEEEIQHHLAMQLAHDLARGLSPEAAELALKRAQMGLSARKEECRDMRKVDWIDNLSRDVRFAARQLRKNPGFTLVAIATLALGLGAAVAIFAYVDAALLQPLPYPEPARLAAVASATSSFPRGNLSFLDYLDWKRRNTVFESLDVYGGTGFLIDTPAGPQPIRAAKVSDGFFRTLGIHPALGRDFHPGEDAAPPNTVLLTHGAWQRRFGGREEVVGQKLILSGNTFEIIGVLPESFQFAPRGDAEVWFTVDRKGGCEVRRSCHNLYGVARLKPGISPAAALSAMTGIAADLEREFPESNRGHGASVVPFQEIVVGNVRPILLVLLAGAGLLLLIACVNVVSLLLVRAESRRRELAIRGALGASASRLLGQFGTEALLLISAGGIAGLVLASVAIPTLLKLVPQDLLAAMPFLRDVALMPRTVVFALALILTIWALCSLIPALHYLLSRVADGLAEGSRGSAGLAWRRLGSKLVVVEFACAMVLLAGAGLLGKSLFQLLRVDLGFQPDHLAKVTLMANGKGDGLDQRLISFGRQTVARLQALPGVQGVSLIDTLPVSSNGNTTWIRIAGRPYNGEHNEVNQRSATADYFRVLGAKLIRGRMFTDAEDQSKPHVVVINQTLARKFFGNDDPIGKQIGDTKLTPASLCEVIGIVDDIREGALDSEIWPAAYYPLNQDPSTYFSAVVRTAGDPAAVLPQIVNTIREIDPKVAISDEESISDRIHRSPVAYLHRSAAWLVGAFAAVALILGIVGLYGVVAYSVGQRTREIGVRMALGAEPRAVWLLILRESAGLIFAAAVLGVLGSVAAARLLQGRFFGIQPWDATVLAAVTAVLILAALLASHLPARRASLVNPSIALRSE